MLRFIITSVVFGLFALGAYGQKVVVRQQACFKEAAAAPAGDSAIALDRCMGRGR